MASYKTPDFQERAAAARASKQSALDKLRNKPAPDPAAIAERAAARAAREVAAAERSAARKAAIDEARAAKIAAAEQAKAEEKVAEANTADRPQPSDAELKALRDARYAARKARKR